MSNFIVTIGREYGSGGKEIGEKVAAKLGFNFYNKNLITEAAKKTGIDEEIFNIDEKQKESFWYTLAMGMISSSDNINSLAEIPADEKLIIEQFKTIEQIADTENCVIVGRCSNHILKNRKNVINIFIYAPLENKIERISRLYNLNKKEAEEQIMKVEKERRSYYNYFTNGEWGSKNDYDLCIDSSKLGTYEIVDFICDYIKLKMEK